VGELLGPTRQDTYVYIALDNIRYNLVKKLKRCKVIRLSFDSLEKIITQ
jgi:hypothetical protein